ncbi:MAG TPA: type II toxin-antitoxin system VapC family toxin [Candidatus Limnocylindria bacterium]|nr:type II toxin-antitoxin system VapC family toxin [Candidatus Limnocylindria bacterium]
MDTSTVFAACLSSDGLRHYGREQLIAPPLLWSEVPSSLHGARWRGDLDSSIALEALRRFERAPITRRSHQRLVREAWRLAEEFGWAKTYDAEFVALAGLLRCRLITLDLRLRRASARLGYVIGPTEL